MLPHVSSVTLACARMGWSVQDTEVISLVTAPAHTAVRRGGQAIVLSRDGPSPPNWPRCSTETGRGDFRIHRPRTARRPARTRIRDGTADAWAAAPPGDVDDLNVVAVRYLPDERWCRCCPTTCFAHDGQITKQAMRAVTLAALAPRPGSRCGMSARARAASPSSGAAAGQAVALAFERDASGAARIGFNARPSASRST